MVTFKASRPMLVSSSVVCGVLVVALSLVAVRCWQYPNARDRVFPLVVFFDLVFAAVHIGLRRAIHERVEFQSFEAFPQLAEIPDVQLRAREADDFVTRGAPLPFQGGAETPSAADNDDPERHLRIPVSASRAAATIPDCAHTSRWSR